jgi:hypothetical protein
LVVGEYEKHKQIAPTYLTPFGPYIRSLSLTLTLFASSLMFIKRWDDFFPVDTRPRKKKKKKNYFYMYFFKEWFFSDDYMQVIESMPGTKHFNALFLYSRVAEHK